jgi:hypothetical protein
MRVAYRSVILLYDRLYRRWFGLDRSAFRVSPVLTVVIRTVRRPRVLPDGSRLECGQRIGELHLDNGWLASLTAAGVSPVSVALMGRREMFASFRALASGPGPLADIRAFVATTIYHAAMQRIGFEAEPDGFGWPALVAFYQRALIGSLRPAGALRVKRPSYRRARRVWLTREALERFDASLPAVSRPAVD